MQVLHRFAGSIQRYSEELSDPDSPVDWDTLCAYPGEYPIPAARLNPAVNGCSIRANLRNALENIVEMSGEKIAAHYSVAARLVALRPPQVKSAILAAVGDYAIEDHVLQFPRNRPVPDHVPRPLTGRVWAEEGARILEGGEIIPGHLASANLIAAPVTGADPRVLAAVIRGAVAPLWPAESLRKIDVPVLILNGRAEAANQKIEGLLQVIPTAPPPHVTATITPHLTSRHFSGR